MSLRESTAAWYGRNARRLSIESSLETVLASYRPERAVPPPAPARAGREG